MAIKNLKYTITNESVTVIDLAANGKSYTVRQGSVNFNALVAALMEQDETKARGYLTIMTTVETWTKGLFKKKDSNIVHGDDVLPDSLSNRIINMITNGEDPQSLLNFWERLSKNPSWRSVNQLWNFLAHKGIPIDQDGFILAYKGINADWTDVHTGTIKNTPGAVLVMPRNKISDDDAVACHYGYHAGALEYASSFKPHDGKIIIVKIDPEDVVCIPKDSRSQKMRTCRYEVIGVYSGNILPSTTANTRNDPATTTTTTKQHPFDSMDPIDLMKQNLGELRSYAATQLHIVGASKIPGGKTALVSVIEETRNPGIG